MTVKECSKLIYVLEEILEWQEKRNKSGGNNRIKRIHKNL